MEESNLGPRIISKPTRLHRKFSVINNSEMIRATYTVSLEHQESLQVKLPPESAPEECPCCGNIKNGTLLSLNCPIKSLNFLGPSFPLFFVTAKYIIYFLCVPLVGCLMCLYINYINEEPNIYVIPSDLEESEIVTQQIFHLIFLCVLMFYHPFSFLKIRNHAIKLISMEVTAADYSVMVSGLPPDYDIEQLQHIMENILEGKHCPVAIIVPTYNLQRIIKVSKLLRDWKFKLRLLKEDLDCEDVKCCGSESILTEDICNLMIEELQDEKEKLIQCLSNNDKGPIAFVTFEDHIHVKEILEKLEIPLFKQIYYWLKFKIFGGTRYNIEENFLTFRRPSHPNDILFENLAVKLGQRVKFVALTTLGSILILGFAGSFLYILRRYQKEELSSDENINTQNLFSFTVALLPSVVILLLNIALEIFLSYISTFEFHTSNTDYKISAARKLIVLMFINTAIIPTVVNAYIVQNQDEWFYRGGLCTDVYVIILINAVCPPLFYLYLFNPLYIFSHVRKTHLAKRLKKKKVKISQQEANGKFTQIEVDLAERYAQIVKTLYVGLFFCPLVPLSVPISMIGCLLEYFVTKYMILRKHPMPSVHNEKLGLEMSEWVRYSIAVYAVGCFFFFSQIDGNTSDNYSFYSVVYIALVTAGLGIVYFCIPINHFLLEHVNRKLIEHCNESKNQMSYKTFRMDLDIDYERANPPTKDTALLKLEIDRQYAKDHPGEEPPVFEWQEAFKHPFSAADNTRIDF